LCVGVAIGIDYSVLQILYIMNNKIFGQKCGLRVSELVLGTGNFGTRWGYGTQADEARKYSINILRQG